MTATSEPHTRARLARFAQCSVGMCMLVGLWTLASPIFSTADESEAELRETGRLLAILLDSGRVAIGRNQALLNDPSKGDKGFTPEVFAAQAMAVFKERTRHDLADMAHANVPSMAKPLLNSCWQKAKEPSPVISPCSTCRDSLQGIYPGHVRDGDRHPISKVVRDISEANGSRPFAP